MPLPVISVLNGAGQATNVPISNSGRQQAADSASVVLSAEDFAGFTLCALPWGRSTLTAPVPVNSSGDFPSRDLGTASGTPANYSYFNSILYSDAAGTMSILASDDLTTWDVVASASVVANVPCSLTTPVFGRYHRTRFTTTTVANTVAPYVRSSYVKA